MWMKIKWELVISPSSCFSLPALPALVLVMQPPSVPHVLWNAPDLIWFTVAVPLSPAWNLTLPLALASPEALSEELFFFPSLRLHCHFLLSLCAASCPSCGPFPQTVTPFWTLFLCFSAVSLPALSLLITVQLPCLGPHFSAWFTVILLWPQSCCPFLVVLVPCVENPSSPCCFWVPSPPQIQWHSPSLHFRDPHLGFTLNISPPLKCELFHYNLVFLHILSQWLFQLHLLCDKLF